MFVVDPDNLSDPAIRRGLLIDLEYALDKDIIDDAEKAWSLLQEFDDDTLDFISDIDFQRIRGVRTVRHICIENISVLIIAQRELVPSWHGNYWKESW